jgi:hypothetical protein
LALLPKVKKPSGVQIGVLYQAQSRWINWEIQSTTSGKMLYTNI